MSFPSVPKNDTSTLVPLMSLDSTVQGLTYKGEGGTLRATVMPHFLGTSIQWQLSLLFLPLKADQTPSVLVSTMGPASETTPLSTKALSPPSLGGLINQGSYYASWNGKDTFIIHFDTGSETESQFPEVIEAFMKAVDNHGKDHLVLPCHPKTQNKCQWTDWKIIALGSATAAFLIVTIILATVLAMKTKHK